jgi:hypothetical protein
LNISLPQAQIEPDLQRKTADALSRYCDFKVLENQRLLEIEWVEGWRTVMIGLIFSVSFSNHKRLCGQEKSDKNGEKTVKTN